MLTQGSEDWLEFRLSTPATRGFRRSNPGDVSGGVHEDLPNPWWPQWRSRRLRGRLRTVLLFGGCVWRCGCSGLQADL